MYMYIVACQSYLSHKYNSIIVLVIIIIIVVEQVQVLGLICK